jgi:predicted cupin superfamily sugar epimerase
MTAEEVVRVLDLAPHPEGGHYRETFRDARHDASGRAASSLIYFLLRSGEISAWHRVDAAEVWHWYAGAPLALSVSPDGEAVQTTRLGRDLAAGERPQFVVPAGWWQAAASVGAWTLVGCTEAPAFEFAGFELAPAGWHPARRA